MIKTQEENRQAGEQPQKMKESKLITLDKTYLKGTIYLLTLNKLFKSVKNLKFFLDVRNLVYICSRNTTFKVFIVYEKE